MVFKLHDQLYGVNIASVLEIIKVDTVTRVPGAPHFIEGIINLRGKVVPVMDLGLRFGLQQSKISDSTRVIIVEAGGVTTGMIVDSVSEVLRLPSSSLEPVPAIIAESGMEALKGVALVDRRMIIILDLGKLLYDHEKNELRGFRC
ncbi:MAG: chemotaxis protein CheW [Bacillota bacterium]